MSTLIDQPVVVQPSEIPDCPPLAAAIDRPEIQDMTERVRQYYADWGLLKPGDGFVLSYDRVSVLYRSLSYGPIDRRRGLPLSLHSIEYANRTDREQTFTYQESRSISASLSASTTLGFKYSTSVNGKIGIKEIIGIGGDKALEFSLSSTLTASAELKQDWSWTMPIIVPPQSRVITTALVMLFYTEPRYTADLEISVAKHPNFDPSYNPLYVAITRGKETTWYHSSLAAALQPHRGGGFLPGRDQNHVIFRCAGKFLGVVGDGFIVETKQTPLGSGPVVSQQILVPGSAETGQVVATLAPPVADGRHAPAQG